MHKKTFLSEMNRKVLNNRQTASLSSLKAIALQELAPFQYHIDGCRAS
jgi:hypothetical protein